MAKLKMMAAVCDEPGEGDVLNLRHVMIDDPHEMEVRVKIDDHRHLPERHSLSARRVGSSEAGRSSATKLAASSNPSELACPKSRIGEKVVLTFTPSCGQCRFCVVGRSVLCEEVARAAAARHHVGQHHAVL